MRKYKTKDIVKCGRRIKGIARDKGLSNEDMRRLLHFENIKSVSYVYSGTSIADDVIDILCKEWDIRIDYLLCNDNFETEEEKCESIHLKEIQKHKKIITYLNSLGFTISPSYFWICSDHDLVNGIEIFKEHIASDVYESTKKFIEIIKEKYPDKQYSDHINNRIPLLSIPKILSEYIDELSNIQPNDTAPYKNLAITDFGDVSILYTVIDNENNCFYIPINKFILFADHINQICITSVKTLLCSTEFTHNEYYDFT